jgi:glycosyltransferase involved in cell wall biosynthesis
MPCLDEAETLALCVDKALAYLAQAHVRGEVLVADNGSVDGSQRIAVEHGARVVAVPEKGYGAALMGGIIAARGRYVIMGDADDSYDFSSLDPFVASLRAGNQLVMGNRFRGGIIDNAMPLHHRYLGNPVLTGVGRLFFGSPVGDFHCGLRGFERNAMLSLEMRTTGMEFASEMIVKATLHGLRIAEVPTTLKPDGRSRPPHLRSWRDGWRHLRFLLLYSPKWLFLYPGTALVALGAALMVWLIPGPRTVGNVQFDITTMLYAGVATIVGFQFLLFAVSSKIYGAQTGILPRDKNVEALLRLVTLERWILLGLVLLAAGIAGSVIAFADWKSVSFGALQPSAIFRIAIPAVTALAIGAQAVFSGFFISVLEIGVRKN